MMIIQSLSRCYVLVLLGLLLLPLWGHSSSTLVYATRIDSVSWSFQGSKFSCQMSHQVNGFGQAVFEKPAGLDTRFVLQSQSPRMQSGQADLIAQPPSWLFGDHSEKLAQVKVTHGQTPVTVGRKTSERMLAELEKGMDLHVIRRPWYEDGGELTVVVPSIGFRQSYSDYLHCLSGLLPVNFSQVEKRVLRYSNVADELSDKTKRYLQKVALYIKEDPSVKIIYIDGHTDSKGIRNENLLKSKQRAEKVAKYLLSQGVPEDSVVTRWHGERYQIASNQSKKGRAKNRRVTVRLSKEAPVMLKKIDEEPKTMLDKKSPPPEAAQSTDLANKTQATTATQ